MIVCILLLLSLGIAVINSSSPELALLQAAYMGLGLIIYFFLKNFDYRSLRSINIPLYIISIFFLIITLILGFETRGSVRWIPIGPFNFQPSEFVKPVLILILANFWSRNIPSWKNILKSLLIILPICLLVFRQPDLGTTLTIFFTWFGMLVASQISIFKLSAVIVSLVTMIPITWLGLQDYQKQRIISFLSPQQDPQGIGFHVIQSTIAVGSGQLFGRGLGRGTQSRLQFLPEFRTDFIFAFIAEELGFLGSSMVVIFYSILFFMGFKLLGKIGDRFGELIVVGVFCILFFQIVVNIGMNIGLLPITGITLPLLSYGGSSVVSTLIMFGIVSSVSKFGVKRKEVTSIFD